MNIGNPDELTLLELAEAVIAITGSRAEIVFEALPDGRPARCASPTSRAPRSCSAGSRRSSSKTGCAAWSRHSQL